MAGRKLNNAAYQDQNWIDETESKNILKKGFISIELTADTQAIAAGSSVDIDGVIYKFDTDELISGIPGGTIPGPDGGPGLIVVTGGSTATAAYSSIGLPEYDNIKKGYYDSQGGRIIKHTYSVQSSSSALSKYYNESYPVENNPYNYRAQYQLVSNTPLTGLTAYEVSGLGTRLIINIGLLLKILVGSYTTMINPFTRTSRMYVDQSLTEDDQYVVNNKGFDSSYLKKDEINYLFDFLTFCSLAQLGVLTYWADYGGMMNPFTGNTFSIVDQDLTPAPIRIPDNTYYTVTEIKDLTDIWVQNYVNFLKTATASQQTMTNPYSGNSKTSNN